MFQNSTFRFKSRRGSVKCCTLSRLVIKKVKRLFLNFRQPNHVVFDFALSKIYQNNKKKGLKSPKNAKKSEIAVRQISLTFWLPLTDSSDFD